MTEAVGVRRRLPTAVYLVLASQGISQVGSEMQLIALPLWMYGQTGSAFAAGLAFAIQYVPIVVLAPWTGYLADRFDRRRLMITCELSGAATVAVTLVGVRLDVLPVVLVFSALTRGFNAVIMPAVQAAIVSTVPAPDRSRSALLSTSLFSSVHVVAPLAGTAVAGTFGFGYVLAIDLLSFLVSALVLLRVPSCPGEEGLRQALRSTWLAVRDGTSPLLRRVVGVEAVFYLLSGADAALALLILEGRFGPAAAGLFATAAACGYVAGSVVLPARLKERPIGLIAVGAVCGPVAAVGFVTLVSHGLVAAFVPGMLVGLGNLAVVTGTTTIFQRETSADLAGRLFAVRRAVLNAMLALSFLLLPGVSAAGVGNKATLVLFSVLMCAAVAPMAWLVARSAASVSVAEAGVVARG